MTAVAGAWGGWTTLAQDKAPPINPWDGWTLHDAPYRAEVDDINKIIFWTLSPSTRTVRVTDRPGPQQQEMVAEGPKGGRVSFKFEPNKMDVPALEAMQILLARLSEEGRLEKVGAAIR